MLDYWKAGDLNLPSAEQPDGLRPEWVVGIAGIRTRLPCFSMRLRTQRPPVPRPTSGAAQAVDSIRAKPETASHILACPQHLASFYRYAVRSRVLGFRLSGTPEPLNGQFDLRLLYHTRHDSRAARNNGQVFRHPF